MPIGDRITLHARTKDPPGLPPTEQWKLDPTQREFVAWVAFRARKGQVSDPTPAEVSLPILSPNSNDNSATFNQPQSPPRALHLNAESGQQSSSSSRSNSGPNSPGYEMHNPPAVDMYMTDNIIVAANHALESHEGKPILCAALARREAWRLAPKVWDQRSWPSSTYVPEGRKVTFFKIKDVINTSFVWIPNELLTHFTLHCISMIDVSGMIWKKEDLISKVVSHGGFRDLEDYINGKDIYVTSSEIKTTWNIQGIPPDQLLLTLMSWNYQNQPMYKSEKIEDGETSGKETEKGKEKEGKGKEK